MDTLAQSILDRFGRALDDIDAMNLSQERRSQAYDRRLITMGVI